MQADFSIELSAGDETLEFPWSAGKDGPRYYDLKQQPGLLAKIAEAQDFPEMGEFLAAINATGGKLETAKCDAWSTSEMNVEDEPFGAAYKFGSYIDLLFRDPQSRFSFPEHENFARQLVQLLKRVPEIPAAAEFLVRRCYYRNPEGVSDGLYFTFYLFGYGADEDQARQQWAIALELVESAIRQIFRR